jgi:hypothetical protein
MGVSWLAKDCMASPRALGGDRSTIKTSILSIATMSDFLIPFDDRLPSARLQFHLQYQWRFAP